MINSSKMRMISVSYVAVLSTTVIFLVTGPQKSSANPVTAVSTAVAILAPFIHSYLGDLRTQREAEKIETRVWMHTGDPNINGCGFYFKVTGYSGKSVQDWFPRNAVHRCGEDEYRMRMTSQSAMYSEKLRLGNDQTEEIQVHADGCRDTFVKSMCFGLSERTIAGGPRAFCIDNDLLKACKVLTNKWNDINLNSDNLIKLTQTNRGIHKMKFNDVENLISGFEILAGNPADEDAVQKVCGRIELVRGSESDAYQYCQAEKTWTETYWDDAGMFYIYETKKEKANKNPDGCSRYGEK